MLSTITYVIQIYIYIYIYIYIDISATVPLGMFGVTEPLSKILRCFDYLEFLHS